MIYLDNAATSNPKPRSVVAAVKRTMLFTNANPGRSGHRISTEAAKTVFAAREEIAAMLGVSSPFQIIFGNNATMALNTAIHGVVRPGCHVVTTALEHNSVLRPLHTLKEAGIISLSIVQPDQFGYISAASIERACTPQTGLVVVNHLSNVHGAMQPIEEIGAACRKRGVLLLIDASQSLGGFVLDISKCGADMVAFPGHKGLLGPQGTGALALREDRALVPLLIGGTGSQSNMLTQPDELPEHLESGTLNTPGIAGLLEGVRFVRRNQREITEKEAWLCKMTLEGLANIPSVRLYGPGPDMPRGSVICFEIKGQDVGRTADALDREHHIAVRAGLHCAPLAHRAQGTLRSGTVRISPGFCNTKKDVHTCLYAIEKLARAKP